MVGASGDKVANIKYWTSMLTSYSPEGSRLYYPLVVAVAGG